MFETILALLKASGADAWEASDTVTEGWEFYFIRHRLDQNRVRDVEHIRVRVCRKSPEGKTLGSASGEIAPTATREEAAAMIARLLQQAELVKNPYYTLNQPRGGAEPAGEAADLAALSRDFVETMRSLPETQTEDVNSYEIFTSNVKRRLVNSEGVDVTTVAPRSALEVVVNARREAHEIELYRMYTSGTCDREGLRARISETMRFGRDRLAAVPTPRLGTSAVVFSTDAAVELYRCFIDRVSAEYRYQQLSDLAPGREAVEGARGDRLTIHAVKHLDNSSANAACDAEGAPVRDLALIEDGVVRGCWGSRQFAQYLNLEDSFIAGNFAVAGGVQPAQALREGPCLEVVEFSDFQVDAVTGDLAGEIRLGYLRDADGVKIVTGGSVSGSLLELAKDMRFSAETVQYDNIVIPAVTRLEGVSVTGAAGRD